MAVSETIETTETTATAAPAQLRPLQESREAYAKLRAGFRRNTRRQLEQELEALDEESRVVGSAMERALAGLAPIAEWHMWRELGPGHAEEMARAEFETLAKAPWLVALDAHVKEAWLLVTVRRPPGNGAAAIGVPDDGLVRVRIQLRDNTVFVDGVEWSQEPACRARCLRWLRMRERLQSAAFLGAGDLVGLIEAAVPGLSELSEPEGAAQQPEARVENGAWATYVERRARLLVSAQSSDALKEADRMMRSSVQRMAAAATRVASIRQALQKMDADEEDHSQELAEEFDSLLRHPGVENIEVLEGGIVAVYTVPIVIRAPNGRRHRIGRFRVDIRPGRGVSMHNLEAGNRRDHDGCDHPHIRGGALCMGDAQTHFSLAIAAGDVQAAVYHAIEFLLSYNPRSIFANASEWPIVADEEAGANVDDEPASEVGDSGGEDTGS